MIEDHNTKIGEAINIESNKSTFRMYHRRHFNDDCCINFLIWQTQWRKWWETLHYIGFLTMVSYVKGTGPTLSNVTNFVLEDDFCKFWSLFTCGSHFIYYTSCWRKRFLNVRDTRIPNFEFICVNICCERTFSKYEVIIYEVLELCPTNILQRLDTFKHGVIKHGFIGNALDVLMSNSKLLQKISLSSCVLLKNFCLMVLLLTPQTLW